MGYYTYYDMQVKDISGKGYNAYKILKYMQDQNIFKEKFYTFSDNLDELLEDINPESNDYELCLKSDENHNGTTMKKK